MSDIRACRMIIWFVFMCSRCTVDMGTPVSPFLPLHLLAGWACTDHLTCHSGKTFVESVRWDIVWETLATESRVGGWPCGRNYYYSTLLARTTLPLPLLWICLKKAASSYVRTEWARSRLSNFVPVCQTFLVLALKARALGTPSLLGKLEQLVTLLGREGLGWD